MGAILCLTCLGGTIFAIQSSQDEFKDKPEGLYLRCNGTSSDVSYDQYKIASNLPYEVNLYVPRGRDRWVMKNYLENTGRERRSGDGYVYEGTSNNFGNSGKEGYPYRIRCYRQYPSDNVYAYFTGTWFVR